MVEASKYLKDYPEIKLAMRGFGVMEQQLKDRKEELKADNVIFYPPVLVQELIPEASKSMVGVAVTEAICLNFKLSVSNKLFEYASAGLPVIMSDIPEHRYLNEKYNFGVIIENNSPEEFAAAAIKLYTDKEFYNRCAQNARRLSEEIYWEKSFEELIEFERSLVK
jgi:glycosyltransferase involved in cell wall biosynthesis